MALNLILIISAAAAALENVSQSHGTEQNRRDVEKGTGIGGWRGGFCCSFAAAYFLRLFSHSLTQTHAHTHTGTERRLALVFLFAFCSHESPLFFAFFGFGY